MSNRLIALQIAIDDYFTDSIEAEVWERITENTLCNRIDNGTYEVWEPFAYYKSYQIIEFVESLAHNIERVLNQKDK